MSATVAISKIQKNIAPALTVTELYIYNRLMKITVIRHQFAAPLAEILVDER